MTAFDQTTLNRLIEAAPTGHAEAMRAAYTAFEDSPIPTQENEDWKYVDLDLDLDKLAPAAAPGASLPDDEFIASLGTAPRVVLIDGFVTQVPDTQVELHRLSELDTLPQRAVAPERNKLAAAASAFGTDGVWVRVPDGTTIEEPLVVDLQAVTEGVISFPRVVIELGRDAEAEVVLVHRGTESAVTVPDIFLDVNDGSRLRFLEVQEIGDAGTLVVHERCRLGRDATARVGQVGIGAHFGRLDLVVEHEGDGSSGEVVGLYFGERDQTLDYRVVMNHSGRNTSSDVFLKGAVEDRAQSVFSGLIRIEKDATRTSAFETNRNLVLSEDAKAHSVPNLEILCDDVVCGHGSSVGPLEEGYIYYLMSRGLSRSRAERLLMRGFFREVLDRLAVGTLADTVEAIFSRRFIRAQEEGTLA